MGGLIGGILALAALGIELMGAAPGGPGLTLALAAIVAAPRTTGTLSVLLGLTALGVALGDGTANLLTPLGWTAHVALGFAMGAVARHADHSTVLTCHERPVMMAVGLTVVAALVGVLPDVLVQLMNPDGTLMQLSVAISEPQTTKQMAIMVPARLIFPPPLHAISVWLPAVAGLTLIALLLGGLLETVRATRFALGCVALLVLTLVVPALADLAQLAGGGPVPLSSAKQLVIELGWMTGGNTGLALQDAPEQGYLTLASRPVVSVLRLVIGLALAHWLWTRRGGGCPAPEAPKVSVAWCWVGAACGVVAWVGFMAFASAERLDVIAAWGAHPVSWTMLSGALIAATAGFGSLFGSRAAQVAMVLEVVALGVWCCGVVAPTAGWLSP